MPVTHDYVAEVTKEDAKQHYDVVINKLKVEIREAKSVKLQFFACICRNYMY